MPEDELATLTFAKYLAGRRRLPMTGWGDFVRGHLKAGTFPDIRSWSELQTVVEHCRDRMISKEEARSSWLSYQKKVREAARS